jgi:hypothetical protein
MEQELILEEREKEMLHFTNQADHLLQETCHDIYFMEMIIVAGLGRVIR